tara:strand:- start:700 stop:1035 length:336 start_codon:yes stop_codon:yes gene_type:complete
MNIKFDEFNKINIHVGTIISIKKNKKARNPALILEIDFGDEIGIKLSSAQITHNYNYKNLINEQIIAVCNFAPKNIAGVISEVLVLGIVDKNNKVVLIKPDHKVENGLKIS